MGNGQNIFGGKRTERRTGPVQYEIFKDRGITENSVPSSFMARGNAQILRDTNLVSLAERLFERDQRKQLCANSFDSPTGTNHTYSVQVRGDQHAEPPAEDRLDWYHSRGVNGLDLMEFTKAYAEAAASE